MGLFRKPTRFEGQESTTEVDGMVVKTEIDLHRYKVNVVVSNDPAAAPALVRAASSGWVRDKDLLDVIAALGASGQAQAGQ